MEVAFFFDTYALYEIIKGNPAYDTYKKGIVFATTKLNLMELHYGLLRDKGKQVADSYYDLFLKYAIEVKEDATIKEANAFRLKFYRRELSYVDCIGYVLAQKLGAKFLTGDKQFKDLPNVEFVK